MARPARALRAVDPPDGGIATPTIGRVIDARITRVLRSGMVEATTTAGHQVEGRCPQHANVGWLRAALAAGLVDAALVYSDLRRPPIVWCIFPGSAHEEAAATGADIAVRGRTVTVRATESVAIDCGPAVVVLRQDGEVRTRGREILSRASGVHRIKGATVRIN